MKQYIQDVQEKEKLLPLVEFECGKIKENFSSEEISLLELDDLDPTSINRCIYGRMVGNCNSARVANFIDENLDILVADNEPTEVVNPGNRSFHYMTPLETYIYPNSEEQEEMDDNDDEVPESVKERINNVINLLK